MTDQDVKLGRGRYPPGSFINGILNECEICNTKFESIYGYQKTCNSDCAKELKNRMENNKKLIPKVPKELKLSQYHYKPEIIKLIDGFKLCECEKCHKSFAIFNTDNFKYCESKKCNKKKFNNQMLISLQKKNDTVLKYKIGRGYFLLPIIDTYPDLYKKISCVICQKEVAISVNNETYQTCNKKDCKNKYQLISHKQSIDKRRKTPESKKYFRDYMRDYNNKPDIKEQNKQRRIEKLAKETSEEKEERLLKSRLYQLERRKKKKLEQESIIKIEIDPLIK